MVTAAGAGTVLGMIVGAAAGHSYTYEFPTTEGSDSARIDTKTAVLRLKNGATIRGTILEELREGKSLIQVTIRHADGTVRSYASSEIEWIEKGK